MDIKLWTDYLTVALVFRKAIESVIYRVDCLAWDKETPQIKEAISILDDTDDYLNAERDSSEIEMFQVCDILRETLKSTCTSIFLRAKELNEEFDMVQPSFTVLFKDVLIPAAGKLVDGIDELNRIEKRESLLKEKEMLGNA